MENLLKTGFQHPYSSEHGGIDAVSVRSGLN